MATAEPAAAVEAAVEDPAVRALARGEVDEAAYASAVLRRKGGGVGGGTAAAEAVARLGDGLGALGEALATEVQGKHAALLEQLGELRAAEGRLGSVRTGVEALSSLLQRLRSELRAPYQQMSQKTQQLAALHATADLLRQVLRLLKLSAKLQEQISPTPPSPSTGGSEGRRAADLAKAAALLAEIVLVRSEIGEETVTKLDALRGKAKFWASTESQVRDGAQSLLMQGLSAMSQADAGAALQVFHNLSALQPAVRDVAAHYETVVSSALATALDPAALAAAGTRAAAAAAVGSGTTTARWRDEIWTRLSEACDSIYRSVLAVWHLQRVLAKKRDPVTHQPFLEAAFPAPDNDGHSEGLLTHRFWKSLSNIVSQQFAQVHRSPNFLRDALVHGFPRLVSLFTALVQKIRSETTLRGIPVAIAPGDEDVLLVALEPFMGDFLEGSMSRCLEAVEAVFKRSGTAGTSVPSRDAVHRLMAILETELDSVSGAEIPLAIAVARNVGKALTALAEKLEMLLQTGSSDARQTSVSITGAQLHNIALVALAEAALGNIDRWSSQRTVPQLVRAALEQSVAALERVAQGGLAPLFRAMVERVEATVLKLHEEDCYGQKASADTKENEVGPSKFMDELEKILVHFQANNPVSGSIDVDLFISTLVEIQNEFLSRIPPATESDNPSVSFKLRMKMAARVFVFFVRHAALCRPLSQPAGRLKLARDCADIERIVSQTICSGEAAALLGAPYRALRAFRPLLFVEPHTAIESSPLLAELPLAVVLHHLYARAPEALVSPHVQSGLTPAQYSRWLDQHSERDLWERVQASLDSYYNKAMARGDKEVSPVYSVMMALGAKIAT